MSACQVYRIVDSDGKGKVAVAVKDIMPGDLVVKDDKPLLHYTQKFLSQFSEYDISFAMPMAAYSTFVAILTPGEKEKVLELFGPTTGFTADNIRKAAAQVRMSSEKDRKMTEDEIEIFVKVAQIVRLNMFETGDGDHAVYSELTRFSHSCKSNCMYSIKGKTLYCFARDYIKAGEELTISYMSERDIEPTHERRFKYLQAKEFTCHCPRCDAPGDDTRQFDCFDSKCKGVMMVCQPINKKKTFDPTLTYTGVVYVEPHLLPCTVCHRAAPAEYQTEMFTLEEALPDLTKKYEQKLSDLLDARKTLEYLQPLLNEIQTIKIPRRHAAALPLLKVELRTIHVIFLNSGVRMAPALVNGVRDYFAALEGIFTYPANLLLEELSLAIIMYIKMCIVPAFEPRAEKEFCLKTLRMHLLLQGRDDRSDILDGVVSKCHEKVTSALSTEVCAFCKESPLHAALTLSRCGRCRQVAYCSVGCQKAHWKLHKKTCKK